MVKALQQKEKIIVMVKNLLVILVVSTFLGTVGGGLLAYRNLTKTVGNLPVEVNNQNMDTSMYPDIPMLEPRGSSLDTSTPVPTLDLTKGGNFVLLYGPIYDNGNEVAQAIKQASSRGEEVYLLIDSPGGSVITGGAIISAMEASPVPVNTVCLQLCASMGAMIHQYGTKRYTVNRSLLMFHDAAGGFPGPFQQVVSRMNMINRYVNKMFSHVAKRTGQQYKDFMQKIGPEIWVDGEDAVAQKYSEGLINVVYNDNEAVNPPSLDILRIKEEIKKRILGIQYIKE
jgi:ATP-dependent Clp endopeptidase proteolytic subunit ClpP